MVLSVWLCIPRIPIFHRYTFPFSFPSLVCLLADRILGKLLLAKREEVVVDLWLLGAVKCLYFAFELGSLVPLAAFIMIGRPLQ